MPGGSGWPQTWNRQPICALSSPSDFCGGVSSILDALQLFGSMHLAPQSWRTLAFQGPPLALLGMTVREARRGEQVKTDCSPFAASALGPFEGVFTHLPEVMQVAGAWLAVPAEGSVLRGPVPGSSGQPGTWIRAKVRGGQVRRAGSCEKKASF